MSKRLTRQLLSRYIPSVDAQDDSGSGSSCGGSNRSSLDDGQSCGGCGHCQACTCPTSSAAANNEQGAAAAAAAADGGSAPAWQPVLHSSRSSASSAMRPSP